MYEENILDHRAAVPEKYIYVSSPPGYSHIMYCLPRQSVHVPTSPSPLDTVALVLRQQPVVVKIRRRPKIANEHSALLAIASASRPGSDLAKQHFLDFLDVSGLDGASELSFATITLPAILPSATLGDWSNAAAETENPVAWVYHVLLSLGMALRFLRQECGIEHGDVHDGNVLLWLNDGSPFGLPALVLIDFESKRSADGETSTDYFDAMTIVHLLAQEAETNADQTWAGFRQSVAAIVLDREAQAERRLEVSRFEEFWEEWKDVAVKERDRAGQKAVAVTREIFEKAVQQKGEVVSDEDLEEAVQSVSSPRVC
ncbi:hypothetical protein E8E11_007307 [Didymella keratinophila]|nr:hypothetical protein E8E11_007307 [Didymella keratinophila]